MPAILLTLIGSRIGQMGMAFVNGWTMAWWKTDAGWRETVAKERAAAEYALKAEQARQEAAAREIAAAATERLEYETTRANDMAARIRELELLELRHEPTNAVTLQCKNASGKLAPIVVQPCRLTGDDVDWVRRLDTAGSKAKSSGATGNIRTRSR